MMDSRALLLATLLCAAGASARTRPTLADWRSRLPPRSPPPPYSPGGTTPIKATASISCSASAFASSLTKHKSSYISAVANVVADVCDPDFDGSPQKAVDHMIGWAGAYAEVVAAAQADCTSTTSGGGTAQGCAWGKADVVAIASAYAEAHAAATAEAFESACTCTNAEAWAFGESSLVAQLVAAAHVEAEAIACAEDSQQSSAAVYVDCYARIIAKTFVQAAAEATAAAGCYTDGSSADASAAILTTFEAEITQWEACDIQSSSSGLAGTSNTPSVFSGFFDRTR